MNTSELIDLLAELIKEPTELEWLEFKHNYNSGDKLGEAISALANGACLTNKPAAYLVFGVDDATHEVVGTNFKARSTKIGNEELETWLSSMLNPRIDFTIYEFDYDSNKHITLFSIPAARSQPVEFKKQAYIRVGSSTRPLQSYPEKAAKIWRNRASTFESDIAKAGLTAAEVISILSTHIYFELAKLPYPSKQDAVISKFISERFITKDTSGYSITNLGAILFAKNLSDFDTVMRKTIRIIIYKAKNKIDTIREQIGAKGYAIGFEGLVDWINSQLPANEEIGKALR